jgi:predicted alpha/beta-fold hydrolase
MPIIASKELKPPFYYFGNAHLQTVIPSLFRKVEGVYYQRERINTPDGDFLDLDWSFAHHLNGDKSSKSQKNHYLPKKEVVASKKLVIVSHGLEGSADRHYVKGVIKIMNAEGWDGLGWNCRSCSGELNRLPRFYHHGDTPDLALVISHALEKYNYETIALVGFSMGGSITLKYFGERGDGILTQVKKGISFSVPCDLAACSDELSKPNKMFYTRRFLKKLNKKIIEKAKLMPHQISAEPLKNIRIFRDFDNVYSSQLHGFQDANEYYYRASSLHYLQGIRRPVLLVNTLNDPFLTTSCFPKEIAENHTFLHLEMPLQGGHVGFQRAGEQETYAEMRTREWLADL